MDNDRINSAVSGMSSISVNAYAKINLCLDMKGRLPGGYHEVEMVMQQIELHDEITVSWLPADDTEYVTESALAEDYEHVTGSDPSDGAVHEKKSGIPIRLTVDDPELPDNEGNLAYRAADLMADTYGGEMSGKILIDIKKVIPMAAGLAGGSSDCGAVIHALNCLWKLNLTVAELCSIGGKLGSDVPFCIMGQAAADPNLRELFDGDGMASHCAIARGRGTDLEPVAGLESYLVLSKPDLEVSTKEVYQGMDDLTIEERPDIGEMVTGLNRKNNMLIEKNMINVLENYTLKMYPLVVYTKNKIQDECNSRPLMSGSGPTVFCLCKTEEDAKEICNRMKTVNGQSYCTRTTF